MSTRRKPNEFGAWYTSVRSGYQELARIVAETLARLIAAEDIQVVSVTWRAKDIDSAIEKEKRKRYRNPRIEMTDLAGIRVITFVESDVPRVAALVEHAFDVLHDKSSDRGEELGVDRSGYRSLHYVCRLGAVRGRLPEFAAFRDMTFEIQSRTALQHAWAEIEHDRPYKFAGVLPSALQRRLFLLAGMLEIADREFSAIAGEVDRYASDVIQAASVGELSAEVNSPSLLSYLATKCQDIERVGVSVTADRGVPAEVVDELHSFGAQTLVDVDHLLNHEFLVALRKLRARDNYIGLLRDAMMYRDLDRYFNDAWANHWQGTDRTAFELLVSKYGERRVKKVFARYEIEVLDDDLA